MLIGYKSTFCRKNDIGSSVGTCTKLCRCRYVILFAVFIVPVCVFFWFYSICNLYRYELYCIMMMMIAKLHVKHIPKGLQNFANVGRTYMLTVVTKLFRQQLHYFVITTLLITFCYIFVCIETTGQATRKRFVGTSAAPVQGGCDDRSNKNITRRAVSNKVGEKW